MAVTLGKNISSLRAQRALSDVTSQLTSTYERLSSGQRINRASDDAAGLSVADSLNVKARLFTQATRNINDGVSLLNIRDSALGEVSSVLTRMTELAEQAANGTFSSRQRASLDDEFRELREEIYRIGQTSQFNGLALFADALGVDLQVGIAGNANSRIRTGGSTLEDGSWVLDRSVVIEASDINLDGIGLDGSGSFSDVLDQSTINGFFRGNLIEFQSFDSTGSARNVKVGIGFDFAGRLLFQAFIETGTGTGQYTRSRETIAEMTNLTGGATESPLLVGIDSVTGRPSQSSITLNLYPESVVNPRPGFGSITLDLTKITFIDGDGSSTLASAPSEFETMGLEDMFRARRALDVTRSRLAEIAADRGRIGADQARLTIASLLASVSSDTLRDAESRIRDADIASESARLVRNQILQQAGAQVLAQANLQPQIALSLLRG